MFKQSSKERIVAKEVTEHPPNMLKNLTQDQPKKYLNQEQAFKLAMTLAKNLNQSTGFLLQKPRTKVKHAPKPTRIVENKVLTPKKSETTR